MNSPPLPPTAESAAQRGADLASFDLHRSARALVDARRRAQGLADFPGTRPRDIGEAYAIQSEAMALWGEPVAGWKVGRLTPDLVPDGASDRFIGPIFASAIVDAQTGEYAFPLIDGGGGAFEAEFILVVSADAPPGQDWRDVDSAAHLLGAMHVGIEIAGGPIAPGAKPDSLCTIADFGNNNGLLFGPPLPSCNPADWSGLHCRARIDGLFVKEGAASDIPGGPIAALAFAAWQAERLGRPLKAGQLISTGAVTGVHPAAIGQSFTADFGNGVRMACRTVRAAPIPEDAT